MGDVNRFNIQKIFSYVGGSLIFFAIAYFIGSNWLSMSATSRIMSTLGVAIVMYAIASLLHFSEENQDLSAAFFAIFALMLPLGVKVTLDQFGYSIQIGTAALIISSVCFVALLITQRIFHRTVLLLFCILFAIFWFNSAVNHILNLTHVVIKNHDLYKGLVIGVGCVLLGRYLERDKKYPLTGFLYFMGIIFILGSSYHLSGFFFMGNDWSFWKVITGILILASFIMAIPLRSRAFLYVASLFLVIYVVDLSGNFIKMFPTGGWSLILLTAGIAIMVSGVAIYKIQHKIFKE